MSEPSREKKRVWRQQRQKEKAEYLFLIYRFMGAERSLTKLLELCGMVGVKISLKTLELYSAKFDWQRRLLELNAEEIQRKEKALATQVEQMNQKHADFAQALLGLAAHGVRFQQKTAKESDIGKTLPLSIPEIVSLYRTAQTGERLARGEATSRVEVWIQLASTVVREFALIFLSVNDIPDALERRAEYIRLSDEMMRRYYSEASRGQIEMRTQKDD